MFVAETGASAIHPDRRNAERRIYVPRFRIALDTVVFTPAMLRKNLVQQNLPLDGGRRPGLSITHKVGFIA